MVAVGSRKTSMPHYASEVLYTSCSGIASSSTMRSRLLYYFQNCPSPDLEIGNKHWKTNRKGKHLQHWGYYVSPTPSTCDGVIFHVEINDSIIDTSFSSWRLKVVVCKYCQSQLNPASFAAQQMGKDAVFKSLGVTGKGAAASMQDIEYLVIHAISICG